MIIDPTALSLGGLAALAALIVKFTDFVKLLTNLPATANQVITQLVVWLISIGVIFLYAASQWSNTLVLSGVSLSSASFATKVLIGLALGSSASFAQTALKALDTSQSAAVPSLRLPGHHPTAKPIAPAAAASRRTKGA